MLIVLRSTRGSTRFHANRVFACAFLPYECVDLAFQQFDRDASPAKDLLMDFASRRVMLDESLVLHFDSAFRRQPSIRWNAKEPASVYHFAPGFWHRRDAELHTMCEGPSVPGRIRAAVILFPNSHPWKIATLPCVAKGQLKGRRKCNKEGVLSDGSIRCAV